MSEVTKPTRKFTKQSAEALVKEFGSIRIRRIAEACFPSDESLAKVEAIRKELAELKEEMKNVPAKFQPMAQKAIDGVEFKLHVALSNMGNPENISAFDAKLLHVASARILKAEKASLISKARFLLENIGVFPPVGTKY